MSSIDFLLNLCMNFRNLCRVRAHVGSPFVFFRWRVGLVDKPWKTVAKFMLFSVPRDTGSRPLGWWNLHPGRSRLQFRFFWVFVGTTRWQIRVLWWKTIWCNTICSQIFKVWYTFVKEHVNRLHVRSQAQCYSKSFFDHKKHILYRACSSCHRLISCECTNNSIYAKHLPHR